jgi:DNA-binding transcriptional ArsR family regulator
VNQKPYADSRRGTAPQQSREILYRLQAEICRALGHPRRLAILDLLAAGEKSSSQMIRSLRASKVNLSQHLAVIRHVGLITARQQGRQTFYRLTYPQITEACHLTRSVLAQRLKQTSKLARNLI